MLALGSQPLPSQKTQLRALASQTFISLEGTGSGAVQHPSPRPNMQHPHAGTATQAGAGPVPGVGDWDRRTSQHPWVLGPWASPPPLERGDRGLGCSHGWDPITLARKKDGTRSRKSGQSTALSSVQGWHSLAHWKGLASHPEQSSPSRKRVYRTSYSLTGLDPEPGKTEQSWDQASLRQGCVHEGDFPEHKQGPPKAVVHGELL